MQQGHIIKNSIIPVTFAALTVKFYTLQLPSAPLFPCAFSSAADKRPVGTDISIAQKTCVFRPVDISVAAAKRSKLIYQSVYSLLGTLAGGYPFRLLTAFADTFPKGSVLALSVTCGDRLPLLSLRDIFPRNGGSLSSKGEPLA